MSPTSMPSIVVRFRWWAMPVFLGSLKVLELLRFVGVISEAEGVRAAEALGIWVAEHGVSAE